MSNTVKTFDQWCNEVAPLNSEERPAAEHAWESAQQAMREQFPYQFTRDQLIGMLCFAYGGVHVPAAASVEIAKKVVDLVDSNPAVMQMIMCCEKAPT